MDVRDAIDADRFVPINFDPITEKKAAIGVSKTNSSASPEQSKKSSFIFIQIAETIG